MDKLEDYLNSKELEMLDMLKTMVEYESPSRNRILTNKFCDYLEDLFGKIGKVTRIVHENKRQKVGDDLKVEFGDGEEQILVLCHMDTVWEEGEIQKRGFNIEDNIVSGPGVYDMKFGLLQIFWVLKALNDNNVKLNYKVVVYINSHEEIGSIQSTPYFKEEAQKSKCVFVLETSAQGGLKIQRKGVRVYNIKAYGKNAHAGGAHSFGVNAIKELAYQIIDIESMTDYNEGITVNVGYMKGGREVNVIPDHAEAKFEVRYWSKEQGEKIDKKLMNLKPKLIGSKLEITLYRMSDPLERKENSIRLYKFAENVGKKLGVELHEVPVGGVSDANRIGYLDIPILDGLGAVGRGAHAKNEFIYKDKIIERINLLLKLMIELSNCKLEF
jgi:glutamate carboxypeptidase